MDTGQHRRHIGSVLSCTHRQHQAPPDQRAIEQATLCFAHRCDFKTE